MHQPNSLIVLFCLSQLAASKRVEFEWTMNSLSVNFTGQPGSRPGQTEDHIDNTAMDFHMGHVKPSMANPNYADNVNVHCGTSGLVADLPQVWNKCKPTPYTDRRTTNISDAYHWRVNPRTMEKKTVFDLQVLNVRERTDVDHGYNLHAAFIPIRANRTDLSDDLDCKEYATNIYGCVEKQGSDVDVDWSHDNSYTTVSSEPFHLRNLTLSMPSNERTEDRSRTMIVELGEPENAYCSVQFKVVEPEPFHKIHACNDSAASFEIEHLPASRSLDDGFTLVVRRRIQTTEGDSDDFGDAIGRYNLTKGQNWIERINSLNESVMALKRADYFLISDWDVFGAGNAGAQTKAVLLSTVLVAMATSMSIIFLA